MKRKAVRDYVPKSKKALAEHKVIAHVKALPCRPKNGRPEGAIVNC
jgi:hypothetical protein